MKVKLWVGICVHICDKMVLNSAFIGLSSCFGLKL